MKLKIQDLLNRIDDIKAIANELHNIKERIIESRVTLNTEIDRVKESIDVQNNIIRSLIDKEIVNDQSCELYIFKSYRGDLIIYLNGEKINTNYCRAASIYIKSDELTNIDLETI